MSYRFNWINSGGGPLIVVEDYLLPHWAGSFGSDLLSTDATEAVDNQCLTDYDRACGVSDYLGIIDVGPGKGLVLDDEPMQTSWRPLDYGQGVMLVRWQWATDEDSVTEALNKLPKRLWEPSRLTLSVSGSALHLFDSACSGIDLGLTSSVHISKGVYLIDTAVYRPDKSLSLVLHRLVLQALQS